MIRVDCDTCKLRRSCRQLYAQHRETLFAVIGHGLPAPDCKDYQPRFYHGIEGVLAAPSPSVNQRVR